MGPSEGNDFTYATQHYVAAKPSTAATEVDPTLSDHHSKRNSAAELSGDNKNDETRKKTPEGGLQSGEVYKARVTGDGKKGSEGHVTAAKTLNAVKAIKQPRSYQIYLVPGINTEKYSYEAGDEDEN